MIAVVDGQTLNIIVDYACITMVSVEQHLLRVTFRSLLVVFVITFILVFG